jgi:peptide/histidine transporter 3/4
VLIPNIFEAASYIIFTISLFEFIIAQSPQTMKGILIGLYYTLRFGLVGLFLLVEYYAFHKYPANDHILNCATAHYLEITLIGLLSLFIFTIFACKYKLRERDEVVNIHIFAEEYYTKS